MVYIMSDITSVEEASLVWKGGQVGTSMFKAAAKEAGEPDALDVVEMVSKRKSDPWGGFWQQVKQLRIPCHIIRGDRTFPYVKAGAARACRLNAHVTQEVIAGGHCFMQQFPQETAARTLHHLAASL